MIDMEQTVEVVWGCKNKTHFISKGYEDRKIGELFYPKLKDVSLGSHTLVEVICDYCGMKYKTKYFQYNKCKKNTKTNTKDCCGKCKKIKAQEYHDKTFDARATKAFDKLYKIMEENNYSLITKKEEYTGIYMKIKYICPKHGEIQGELNKIINSHCLCNLCGNEKIGKLQRYSSEEIEGIINSINNNKILNPQDYINNNNTNLIIQCQCGNRYTTSLTAFLNGKNQCGQCSGVESRGEQKIRQWLECNNIDYIPQYSFNDCRDKHPLPFDFYLNKLNCCIEFDGEQHYRPAFGEDRFAMTQKHDQMKNQYCKNNNINLIRIKYTHYRTIDKILSKELLNT